MGLGVEVEESNRSTWLQKLRPSRSGEITVAKVCVTSEQVIAAQDWLILKEPNIAAQLNESYRIVI